MQTYLTPTLKPIAAALLLALGAVAGSAHAGKSKPTMPLNDTGMTQCLVDYESDTYGHFTTECTGTGQDGEFGRDVTNNKPKDGLVGFSFQKICNSGEVAGTGNCPSDPKQGKKVNQWGCTQDKVSGLIWEVKTKDGGLRDWRKVYTNFGDGRPGDASEFVIQVNQAGLCGAKDWVLPSARQLHGLVDIGLAQSPMLDSTWFPLTAGTSDSPSFGRYWVVEQSLRVDGYYNPLAMMVSFGDGTLDTYRQDYGAAVRLVRAAPQVAKRFVASVGGDEITDNETGLIWRRCLEGLSWNGTTCAGVPGGLFWWEALPYAKSQAQLTGKPWRLPTVKEAASILDFSYSPPVDPTAFPGTWWSTWTSTPASPGYFWWVNLETDSVWSSGHGSGLNIRLVRDSK